MASTVPPRRFKVQPIETTVKTSKDRPQEQEEEPKPRRRFAPEPIETTVKTTRKLVPEPIETTLRSTRRFAPQLVETRRRNSREKFAEEWATETTKKFKPESTNTTSSTNRKQPKGNEGQKRPPRRFAPLLIETARRSRRAGDASPTLLPSDKTEVTSGNSTQYPKKARFQPVPPPPDNTPTIDVTQNPLFLEIQRATSPQAGRRPLSRASTRSHSFRVPDLDPIESSESEPSSPPSLSTSPSAISDHSYMYREATRMRESVDDRVSGYLLELAARAAEKQLREQAMAAFPNDDYHEPVDHYIDRDSDDAESYTEAKRGRDSSFTEVNWDLVAMQEHRKKLDQQQKQESERAQKQRRDAETNNPVARQYNPWGNPATFIDTSNSRNIIGYQKDPELDRMRKGARPPMLGGDIRFPRCSSPEPARFDPTQGCDAVKIAMCYLSEQNQQAEKGEGLWCGNEEAKQPNKVPSLWSNASSRPPSRTGLWGGCCVNSGHTPPRGPTGLLTPRVEIENPLETPCPTPAMSLLPPTPPASNADFACIDEKLSVELSIEEEFGDDFVTQVYNYLSLGYPSMARPFDGELSKLSQIPITELRQDDHLVTSRGYIRLGKDGNLADAEITEESCMRWRALRTYIREWARQRPAMAGDNPGGGIGAAVRRGSWAI